MLAKYFIIWSKSCFRLRLELCPGSSFADYGGVSLFPLTTKYLEKFNGNHNYNLENPIVASHFSSNFVVVLSSNLIRHWGFSSNLIRKRVDQLQSNVTSFFPSKSDFYICCNYQSKSLFKSKRDVGHLKSSKGIS